MECIRRELGGVALGGGEATDSGVNGVDVDQGSVEDGGAVDHLGDGGSCRLRGPAALGVKADLTKAPLGDQERNAREIPTGSPTRSARESAIDNRPTPALIGQIVLEQLSFHLPKGKALPVPPAPTRANRAATHTYLPCGCGWRPYPSAFRRSATISSGSSCSCRQVTWTVR